MWINRRNKYFLNLKMLNEFWALVYTNNWVLQNEDYMYVFVYISIKCNVKKEEWRREDNKHRSGPPFLSTGAVCRISLVEWWVGSLHFHHRRRGKKNFCSIFKTDIIVFVLFLNILWNIPLFFVVRNVYFFVLFFKCLYVCYLYRVI